MTLLSADNTSFKLELLETATLAIVATSQLETADSPKTDARMLLQMSNDFATAIIAVNQETLRILKWTVSLSGQASEVLQLSLDQSLKVMFMSYWDVPGKEPLLKIVAVDTGNRLRLLHVKLSQAPAV